MNRPLNLAYQLQSRLKALKHSMGFRDSVVNETLDILINELREPVPFLDLQISAPPPEDQSFDTETTLGQFDYLAAYVRILSGRIDREHAHAKEWRDKLLKEINSLLDRAAAVQERFTKYEEKRYQMSLDMKTFSDQLKNDHESAGLFSSKIIDAVEDVRHRLASTEKIIGNLDRELSGIRKYQNERNENFDARISRLGERLVIDSKEIDRLGRWIAAIVQVAKDCLGYVDFRCFIQPNELILEDPNEEAKTK